MFNHYLAVVSAVALAVSASGCTGATPKADASGAQSSRGSATADPCPSLETREPTASGQRPAFAGQTRACEAKSNVAFDVVVLTKGLEHPWAVEPLPGGDLLVTEKPGRIRIVSARGEVGEPIAGVPAVDARGQ